MILAADYDPSLDMREDERRRVNGVVAQQQADVEMVEEEVVEEMEDDDVDDMFAVGTTEKKKRVKKVKVCVSFVYVLSLNFASRYQRPAAPALITTTLDTASDAEGYYQTILGEQLDGGQYQVFALLGKGMFANVVRARVLQGDEGEIGREVAIKIIRCQESMYAFPLLFGLAGLLV
jgi:serine/threonine-protein kinase PRP4